MTSLQKRPVAGQVVILNKVIRHDTIICANCGIEHCSSAGTILSDDYFTCNIGDPPYSILMNCTNERHNVRIIKVWHNSIKCAIV